MKRMCTHMYTKSYSAQTAHTRNICIPFVDTEIEDEQQMRAKDTNLPEARGRI